MTHFITIFFSIFLAFTALAEEANLTQNTNNELAIPEVPALPSENSTETTTQESKPLTAEIYNDTSVQKPAVINAVPAYKKAVSQSLVEPKQEIEFSNQWMRMPAVTSVNTAAYLNITNNSDKDIKITDALLVGDYSERTEIHGYKPDDNGVKKMFKLESVTIPANSTIEFKPGSFHIMIMGLKKPLEKGSNYEMKFVISLASDEGTPVFNDYYINLPVR